MNDPTTITFKPGIPPKGPDRTRVFMFAGLALLLAIGTSILGLLLRAHPDATNAVLDAAAYLLLLSLVVNLLTRVQALEKAHKDPQHPHTPGPFQQMVEDAKAAARVAGHDETAANAVAQEVLTTSIRRAGGWKA